MVLLKAGANQLSKDNNDTTLDIATSPIRRLLLKSCGNMKVAFATACCTCGSSG